MCAKLKKMTGNETQKISKPDMDSLKKQKSPTMEPLGLGQLRLWMLAEGFLCMKATWQAASLMKFVLSNISNLQGCCHPRGSEQQDLFASTPTGNNKQQPWAPAPARSTKATSSLQIQQQKDGDIKGRTHSPPRSTKFH